MATEYKGVPIGSLPEATSLNSSDELIAYRGGQAYRSDVGHLGETANGNISDAFSTSVSYAVGDYCIYNDTLYKCTTAHDKASWDSSHFEAVTVGEELSELNTNLFDGEPLTYNGATYGYKFGKIVWVSFRGVSLSNVQSALNSWNLKAVASTQVNGWLYYNSKNYMASINFLSDGSNTFRYIDTYPAGGSDVTNGDYYISGVVVVE